MNQEVSQFVICTAVGTELLYSIVCGWHQASLIFYLEVNVMTYFQSPVNTYSLVCICNLFFQDQPNKQNQKMQRVSDNPYEF